MSPEQVTMVVRLLGALVAGSLIGFERSHRGRPAGFRTHALVCLASTLLMLLAIFDWGWPKTQAIETIRLDPTRMAQGIMTGIGFLGAGVIFKQGLTVRGLTTAASIWITAAIGILIGVGFYFPAALSVLLVLFVLTAFQWVESRMPVQNYARLDVVYPKQSVMDETALLNLLAQAGFSVDNLEYRLVADGKYFGYRMMIRTTHVKNLSALAHQLRTDRRIQEFRISPAGD